MSIKPSPGFVPVPGGSLAKMARMYVPFTIRSTIAVGTINSNSLGVDEGQELKAMKVFFDNRASEFRMFGSVDEFWEQIKVFIDFQGNNKYFGLDPSIHYNHTFKLYHEMRNERSYVQKNDIFLYIQNYLMEKDSILKMRISLIMLTYFFKSQEKKLGDTVEFVLFEPPKFDELKKEIDKLLVDMKKAVRVPASGLTWKKVLQKFKKLLPVEMTETEMSALVGVFKHLFSLAEASKQQADNVSTLMYTYLATIIPGLQKIVEKRPEWFLPNSRLNLKNQKPVIRLIIDDVSGYVLSTELGAAVKPYTDQQWLEPALGIVGAIEADVAFTMWRGHGRTMDQIDFVIVPTTHTKHRFVPIPTGNGFYCKPAVEVLLELLRDQFFGSNIFQNPNQKTSEIIIQMFGEIEYVFNPDIEEIHLVDNRMVDNLNRVFHEKIRRSASPKLIRDVSKTGFTAENLKEELQYLTVDGFFEDVLDNVTVVYDHVVEKKKKTVLRTCDMFDAVEGCMLLSVFKKFPKMASFLHCHKSCSRIHGLNCQKCQDELKNPKKKQHFVTFGVADADETDPKKAGKMTKIVKVDIMNEELKIIEKPITKPHQLPKIEKSTKIVKKKEEIECEKCQRTIERTEEANGKFQENKKKIEELEQEKSSIEYEIALFKTKKDEIQMGIEKRFGGKMKDLKMELEKLNGEEEQMKERIEMMERQLLDGQTELNNIRSSKISGLEKIEQESTKNKERLENENLRLEVQNEEKDKTIKKLMSRLVASRVTEPTVAATVAPTVTPPTVPTTTAPPTSSASRSERLSAQFLTNLEQIRGEYRREDPIRRANTMAQRLITLSDDENVKNQARYELDRMTAELQAYFRRIEENIELIKENPQLPPHRLPQLLDRPQFSRIFMEEYERLDRLEQQNNDELDDTECLICLQNMTPATPTIKCGKCKRRFHSECASEWLTQKSVCPTCDRKMLHPADYPPLN